MFTPRTASATRVPRRVRAVYCAALALLLLFFALMVHDAKSRRSVEEIKAPDDVRAARELLAQKFTGPQYFHIGEGNDTIPFPYISVVDAKRQMERIVKERNMAPAAAMQINGLIEELTVPAPSRVVVGIDHVNALQLNLALDNLR